MIRKNANTPVVKAHAQRGQKAGNIYVGKYSPAQLIKEIQLKAVIKYFYSFSNNPQKKVIIFCADKGVVKLAISNATSGSTLLENKLAI